MPSLGAAGSSLAVAQVIAVADATRRDIERDLHDGLQQQLVSLALRVRAVEAMVPAELVELRAELSGVVDEHTNLLDQLREIAHGIHPAILSEDGLKPALKTLARRSPIPSTGDQALSHQRSQLQLQLDADSSRQSRIARVDVYHLLHVVEVHGQHQRSIRDDQQ